jgi:hypothetical protein
MHSMRIPQHSGTKGSLKWIQGIAERREHPVNVGIRAQLSIPDSVDLEWNSPRADDEFAEYRDAAFLKVLGLERLSGDLAEFWPNRGPQWDALGRTSTGQLLLVEAKAHIAEMASNCEAGTVSLRKISDALDAAKLSFGAALSSNWLSGFYQYANRLAHLHFLRAHAVDAHLVGVYFLGDREMRGPEEISGWAKAIDDCNDALGLPESRPPANVHHVFVRVGTS